MRVCYQAWCHIRVTGKFGGSAEMDIAGRQWSVIGRPGKVAHIVVGGMPYQDTMTWEQ